MLDHNNYQQKNIRTYGRIKGRNINNSLLALLPIYQFDSDKILQSNKDIYLDIGSGYGDNIIYNALNNPHNIYIACEVYLNGIVNTIKLIENNKLNNIYIYQGDIRNLLDNINNVFFKTVWLLFPDPWHKKKHYKRRIVTIDFIDKICDKIITEYGNFILATDHTDYANHIKTVITQWLQLNLNYKKYNFIFNEEEYISKLYYPTRYHNKSINNISSFLLCKK